MNHNDFKKFFEAHYAIVRVDVMENGDKKVLENPGGSALMAELKGEKAGLPFFAMLDDGGKMVINSIRPANGADKGGNTGHPMTPEEVAHFMTMIKKTAPRATKAELDKLEAFLLAQKRGG